MPADSAKRLGLIAGQGRLPLLVASGMKAAGAQICCVGLRDQYDSQLPALCDQFEVAGLVRIGRWIKVLRRGGVREAVMVGAVTKKRIHDRWRLFRQMPDWRAAVLWYRHLRHDRRNAAVLAAVADELSRNGITLIDSTTYIQDQLAGEGVMTRAPPTAPQRADVEFGWPLLLRTVELDIGQSIAVRDRDVIAVEAVEGTDAMIERAGNLSKARGWTLLKTAKREHDMRADVPTIGVGTIERAAKAGCGCIAVGAGRVILVDRASVLEAADRARVAVIGIP
ncbi:MAG: UDP-2,3-diacylglucosamine diphosphatase LpxI [Phycisphaerales bacterium]|nr:UDP-2,3-diacylglucosamine diphosphatase LpxI [Phycisphaerales bacterium]MCI0676122.1 UDP-2,3-diacylglucosamine diphosphatase LpxI [Phycisphaerales bacterium]